MRPVVSSLALVLSAAAAVFTAMMLLRSETPAVRTVVMVPPASPTYSAAEVAAAKQAACAAWSSASTAMAHASNALGDTPKSWADPATKDAAAAEARTTLVEGAYLREQVGPATPAEISEPIHDFLVAAFDQQDVDARRMGSQADAVVDRINAAVDKVNVACGLK